MAEKTQKKGRSRRSSSDGEARKRSRSRARDEDVIVSRKARGVDSVSARIEKIVGERLSDSEPDGEEKKTRRKVSSRKTGRAGRARRAEDSEGAVKRINHTTDSSPTEPHKRRRRRRRKTGLLDQVLSLMPGLGSHDYDELINQLEQMDEFGKAAEVDSRLEAFMMFLYETYWRVETSGLENIPDEGRALIVSNHSGVLPFDGAMMATAIYKFHPAERIARFMIEDWFGMLPFAMEFMNAVGQVRACQENAERLLRQEQLVGVFPEGIKGMAKGFKDRYNLARFGRGGVVRLAIRTRSPVIPCAVVGAEEIYIVLGYANWLGKMFGMPLFPITATFPWLGPLGFVPLPTKWHIQFGEVISYDEYDDSALKDNVIINRLNRQLRTTVQEMVDSLLKKRRSLFLG